MRTLSDRDSIVRIRLDLLRPQEHCKRLPFDVLSHGVVTLHESCWQSLLNQQHDDGSLGEILKDAKETAEYWDSQVMLQEKVEQVAQLLIADSNTRVVVFTGAGISTAAGIGDFRGIFGQWTEDDMQHASSTANGDDDDEAGRPTDNVPYTDLRPTYAHEGVAWMVEQGTVEHVVTQNCDGLHRLSGIPPQKLSELHGNIFIEYCRQCGTEYERPFDVENSEASEYYEALEEGTLRQTKKRRGAKFARQCPDCRLTHQTVRSCDVCPDHPALNDTIINFGDSLRDCQIGPATTHCHEADVIIVLGSTLQVTPAANLCRNKKKKLVICNRQRTSLDRRATVRAFADCDAFVDLLLRKLMGEDVVRLWKEGRGSRLATYERKRQDPLHVE